MQIYLSILPKNKLKNSFLVAGAELGKYFARFLEELRWTDLYLHYEIRELTLSPACNSRIAVPNIVWMVPPLP